MHLRQISSFLDNRGEFWLKQVVEYITSVT